MGISVRETAFKLLLTTLHKDGYSNHLFEAAVARRPDFTAKDRAFLMALYYGVLRQLYLLDHIAKQRVRGDYEQLPPAIKMALRMGIYQIISMNKVPESAAVNESVNLSRKYGHAGTVKLVNAVLRKVVADSQPIKNWIDKAGTQSTIKLSTIYSHPEWMVSKYIDLFGYNSAIEILKAASEPGSQNYRINDFTPLSNLSEGVIRIDKNEFVNVGAILRSDNNTLIEKLKYDNVIAPQDQSSLIASSLVAKLPGDGLELCCGRGNKTEAIHRALHSTARSICGDRGFEKLKELNSRRLKGALPVCLDAASPLPLRPEAFDWVFIDAPCTNSGVIRRHPEIRYRITPQRITEAADLQLAMLHNAAPHLKAGGKLLYSVCSFEPEETFGVIDRFLADSPAFRLWDISIERPDLAKAGLLIRGAFRSLPGQHGMDGFFACLLEKSA